MGGFHYEEWLARVPESIKRDPLWDFQAYPKALLLSDMAWEDTNRMMKDPPPCILHLASCTLQQKSHTSVKEVIYCH